MRAGSGVSSAPDDLMMMMMMMMMMIAYMLDAWPCMDAADHIS